MSKPRKYAEGTQVPISKTQGEILGLLEKHGATQYVWGQNQDTAVLQFTLQGIHIKQSVAKPDQEDFKRRTYRLRLYRSDWIELEWKRRWRALLLIVKAKLELISSEESTVIREFLPDVLLSDGSTVMDRIVPQLQTGRMPNLQLNAPQEEP